MPDNAIEQDAVLRSRVGRVAYREAVMRADCCGSCRFFDESESADWAIEKGKGYATFVVSGVCRRHPPRVIADGVYLCSREQYDAKRFPTVASHEICGEYSRGRLDGILFDNGVIIGQCDLEDADRKIHGTE